MRVLHYVDENRLAWMMPWIQLLKELEKCGVENHVVCRSGGTLSDELTRENVEHYTYNPVAQWLPAAAFGVGRLIDRVKPDLIHTRLSAAAALGGYWGQRKKVPVLSTFDKYPKAKYYRHSDVLIGCSSAVTAHVKSLGLKHAFLTETILNPVLAERYSRDDETRRQFRRQHSVGDDETVVLGMGRFVDWKAWDDYLRAVALLPTDVKAHFWLVGSGPEEANLKKLARLLKVEERVQFFPFAADVRPWLWSADLFVQTSKEPEGFSLMLIEAMAAGAVPLATNIGGTLDIVRDGQNGLLFSPSDIKFLSELMVRGMDGAWRRELSECASKSAAEVNVREVARQTVALYEKTLRMAKERGRSA
ncbi:MAG: glycosyltransferase [Pyramidobacter sp.]